jgi:putative SOS response-associated peptidase YedK
MCGRFTRKYSWNQLHALLDLKWPGADELPAIEPSFNVAPTQDSVIVRTDRDDAERADAALMRWGLVPAWADDLSIGSKMINARAESAHEKPAFRKAFAQRRCVVPASGFYEWRDPRWEGEAKQPFYITRSGAEPILFAGLWERWRDKQVGDEGGEVIETFTILTTRANGFMERFHHRMPVVLEPEAARRWVDRATDLKDARQLLGPASDGVLGAYPVSRRVNSPKHNDEALLEPVEEEQEGEGTLFG